MLRILVWLFIPLLIAAGVIFTVYNPHVVILHYVLGSLHLPLAVAMLLSLWIGVFLGVLFSLSWVLKLRQQLHRLRKAQQQNAAEIQQLNSQLAATRDQA